MAKKKVSQSQQEKSLPKQEDIVKAPKEVRPSMDSESSEKLESLKSLNQMLVKEAFERRQQVESLVQSKGCLETELTRSNSEKEALNSELTRLAESAAMLELERTVVSVFCGVQLDLKGEAIEQKMRELKIVIDEKEGEIERLTGKLTVTEGALGNEREVSKRVRFERDAIKDKLDLQIENGKELRASLIESEEKKGAVERELGELKAAYNDVEMRFESVTREKDSVERSLVESEMSIEEMKEKVSAAVKENERVEEEKAAETVRRKELEGAVSRVSEMVVSLQKEELKLRAVVAELEEKCFVGEERRKEMEREIYQLVEEKKMSEKKIEGLSGEKIAVERDLSEALTKFEAMVNENSVLVEAKGGLESEVAELKGVVLKLDEKIKSLESEVGEFDKVKMEKNEMNNYLDEERKSGVRLKEMVRGLEEKIEEKVKVCEKVKAENGVLFSEKAELESTCELLKKEIRSLENTVSEARREFDLVKGKVGKADANAGVVLSMLKGTAAFCTDVGAGELVGNGEETEAYAAELEMIKDAFKDKENKIESMKRQMEVLQGCVEDARKKKSFWTVLSSATTLLAAVSLAYVARGH
ncbi:hypothetical protein PHJA_000319500 [Phtheirospermum japonicum]|uniref:Uncharacterized protein n=1 Tax=Phtheirospermum japonicum TaxID=374723 RepID=A0A830B7H9_9LAMI|nr:hypothetical protein PHJA_000319500 [Phtheirospermum japonicum]